MTPLLWGLSSLLGLWPGCQPIRHNAARQTSFISTLFPLVVASFEKVVTSALEVLYNCVCVFSEAKKLNFDFLECLECVYIGDQKVSWESTLLHVAVAVSSNPGQPFQLFLTTGKRWIMPDQSLTYVSICLFDIFSLLVPQDYSYLPESSILYSLYSLLEGCHGNTTSEGRQLLCAVLYAVVTSGEGDLPPVNWSHLLVPCLRAGLCFHDDSLEKMCVTSLKQSCGFQQLLGYCIHPLVVTHLQVR